MKELTRRSRYNKKISDKQHKIRIRELMDDGTGTNSQCQMNENYIEALRADVFKLNRRLKEMEKETNNKMAKDYLKLYVKSLLRHGKDTEALDYLINSKGVDVVDAQIMIIELKQIIDNEPHDD